MVTSIFPFKALKSRSVTSPLLVTATFLSAEAAVISALSALLIIMSWVAVDELNVTLFPLAFTSRSLVEPVVDKVVSAKYLSLYLCLLGLQLLSLKNVSLQKWVHRHLSNRVFLLESSN